MQATAAPNITTHNGTITLTSTKSGDHRTFRIKTQAQDSKFAPGERIIALMTGADNTSDYTQFGFVQPDGTIRLWKTKSDNVWVDYKRVIERLDDHMAAGRIEVRFEGRCRICNRVLTTPESIDSGIGPVCAGR